MEKSGDKLERITITLPHKLVEEVEDRIVIGMYATMTEWVRNAIRLQLQREKSPMDRLIESDVRVAESLRQAEGGQVVGYDVENLIKRHTP